MVLLGAVVGGAVVRRAVGGREVVEGAVVGVGDVPATDVSDEVVIIHF